MKTLTLALLLAAGTAIGGDIICYPSGNDTVCEEEYGTRSYYCFKDGDNTICEEE